jgi:hypothetical protein
VATGESAQCGLGGLFGIAEIVAGAESGAGRNDHPRGQVAQLGRTGDDEGLDLIRGLATGFDRTGSCDAERSDRLDPAVTSLRHD